MGVVSRQVARRLLAALSLLTLLLLAASLLTLSSEITLQTRQEGGGWVAELTPNQLSFFEGEQVYVDLGKPTPISGLRVVEGERVAIYFSLPSGVSGLKEGGVRYMKGGESLLECFWRVLTYRG